MYKYKTIQYSEEGEPTEYKGFLIYQRWDRFGYVFDIVKDNICVMQMAGLNGAKCFIDAYW